MAILKEAVKYGGLFMIAKEGIKAYEKHGNNNNNGQQGQQSRDQPQWQQQQYQQYPQQNQQYQQQQIQSSRDASGYLHQTWCNGQCNGQCNGSEGYVVRDVEPDFVINNERQSTKPPAY